MARKKHASALDGDDRLRARTYSLDWPSSERWNSEYDVPRNSIDSAAPLPQTQPEDEYIASIERRTTTQSALAAQDLPEKDAHTAVREIPSQQSMPGKGSQDILGLSHWLEILAELYMNNIDNLARWAPRWLNVTRKERYDGLKSASVSVIDWLEGEAVPQSEIIIDKSHLAATLQSRPENSALRVILVTDLSRFVMGSLGHIYSIDHEFWFEHLANSGYAGSDSQLKISSAAWMNWAEQELRFRHRPLPGPGQRTEWNTPYRVQSRRWAHLRWGRLALLHYLGKKGFHEDEINGRLADGRWMIEKDVNLDKHGLLMTQKRQARANRVKEKQEKQEKKNKSKSQPTTDKESETARRIKATNVYRPYSTFEGLPLNVTSWYNRDLRVLAPEGISYWSGPDSEGRKTIILLVDPTRSMRETKTKQLTPALTFMPRMMELESYSEEELWRTAGPEETFLDPPKPPFSKAEQKQRKRQLRKERQAAKRRRGDSESKRDSYDAAALKEAGPIEDPDSSSASDSEYDEEYEEGLRDGYKNAKSYVRDRDFARKYSLSTHDLILRHLRTISYEDISNEHTMISSMLGRLVLDDFWQLISEIRLELDHLDGDLSSSLYQQLVESIGNSTRQNLTWIRATLQELREWSAHLSSSATLIKLDPDTSQELAALGAEIGSLQSHAEQSLSLLATSMALAQSSLVIDQTSGINKVTELAFFFVPISFITSVFSMQVLEFTDSPPKIWMWAVTLSAVILATYFIRSSLRSPSVRVAITHCRATIINRFSSSKAGSPSQRLNSVGNRAILKYMFYFTCVVSILIVTAGLWALACFLAFGGVWVGAMAVALYFIITRWPDPIVLVLCFLSLPLSALGWWATLHWATRFRRFVEETLMAGIKFVLRLFPEQWTLEKVEDEDLAKEGVNTYTRQALTLAT